MEDYISLKMKVNDLLKKGYIREFLSDKDNNLFNNKEENNQLAITTPASPPQYNRLINIITAKKSTRNAKNDQETAITKCMLM